MGLPDEQVTLQASLLHSTAQSDSHFTSQLLPAGQTIAQSFSQVASHSAWAHDVSQLSVQEMVHFAPEHSLLQVAGSQVSGVSLFAPLLSSQPLAATIHTASNH